MNNNTGVGRFESLSETKMHLEEAIPVMFCTFIALFFFSHWTAKFEASFCLCCVSTFGSTACNKHFRSSDIDLSFNRIGCRPSKSHVGQKYLEALVLRREDKSDAKKVY